MVALKKRFNPESVYDELSRHMGEMLIILNADGVLYDYERFSHYAAYDVLSKFNNDMPCKKAFSDFLIGIRVVDQLAKIKSFFKLKNREINVPNNFEWMRDVCQNKLFEQTESQIVKNVLEFINLLKAGNYVFCLATRSRLDPLMLKLKKTGLNQFFNESNIFHTNSINSNIVAQYADENGIEANVLDKDKTSVFIAAAASFGYKPENCLVVEDTYGGVLSGINSTMNVACFIGAPSTDKETTIEKVKTILAEEFIFDSLI